MAENLWDALTQLVRENSMAAMDQWNQPTLGAGIRSLGKNEGIDTYGSLHGTLGVKGRGYFGPVQAGSDHMTELSTEDDSGAYPLIVPTLSKEELSLLTQGGQPTPEIYKKAREHADLRRANGLNPFSDSTGLAHPLPKK